MRMTKKDHTLLWLSRLRLNPGKQMGFAAEGQEEQAWMSSWPASASKEEKRGSRVPWIENFKRNRGLRLVPEMLQVLHLCKHVGLNGSQLLQQPRPWDSPHMCHRPGPDWAPGEHGDIHRRHIACPVLESKLSDALNSRSDLLVISKTSPQASGTLQMDTVCSVGPAGEAEHAVVQGIHQPSLHSPSPGGTLWPCSSWHFKVAVKWQEFPWQGNHHTARLVSLQGSDSPAFCAGLWLSSNLQLTDWLRLEV